MQRRPPQSACRRTPYYTCVSVGSWKPTANLPIQANKASIRTILVRLSKALRNRRSQRPLALWTSRQREILIRDYICSRHLLRRTILEASIKMVGWLLSSKGHTLRRSRLPWWINSGPLYQTLGRSLCGHRRSQRCNCQCLAWHIHSNLKLHNQRSVRARRTRQRSSTWC